jgi:hypothetical protein
MSDEKDRPPVDGRLSCALCMREIPPEVELSQEGQEYVHYFCGLACYRAWHERGGAEAGKPEGA